MAYIRTASRREIFGGWELSEFLLRRTDTPGPGMQTFRTVAILKAELGGDDHAVPDGRERLADEGFIYAARIIRMPSSFETPGP